MSHGNSGVRIKFLVDADECPHHNDLSSRIFGQCAMATCDKEATQCCLVIMANQNAQQGKRNAICLCNDCYDIRGTERVWTIRTSSRMIELSKCTCGKIE